MTTADDMAALKARVAELERANKPPEPFKPDPDWRPINPIDRVGMDPSVMRDLADAVPDHISRGIYQDSRAPKGPSSAGAIPSSQQVTNVRGTGWATPIPIRPPDGVNHADRLMDEQDRRDRAELAQRLGKR